MLVFNTLLLATAILGFAALFIALRPGAAAASKSNVLVAAVLTLPLIPLVLQIPVLDLPVLAYGAASVPPVLQQFSVAAKVLVESVWPFAPSTSRMLLLLALLIYFSGVALALVRLLYSLHFLQGLCRTATPVNNLDLTEYAAEDLGEVNIYSIAGLASPLAFGLWRKRILIPEHLLLEQSDPRQLSAVLRHELSHIRRSDPLLHVAISLVLLAVWWHPLARALQHKLRLHAELATDDQVLLDGMDCADYAAVMLQFSREQALRNRPTRPAFPTIAFWAPGRTQWERINAVLGDRRRLRTSRSRIIELLGINIVFVLLLSTLQFSAALEPSLLQRLAIQQAASQQQAGNPQPALIKPIGGSDEYLR